MCEPKYDPSGPKMTMIGMTTDKNFQASMSTSVGTMHWRQKMPKFKKSTLCKIIRTIDLTTAYHPLALFLEV